MIRSRLKRRSDPIKKRLDALCREVTFARDKHACVFCGKTVRLQWCHCRSRRYASTRWMTENCLCLCSGCHLDQHANPLKWATWFTMKYPARAEKLAWMERTPQKVDRKLIELYLRQELARYA